MTDHDDLDAPELRPIVEQLRAGRPEMTALELDDTKRRIRARAATPARRRTTKGTPMKSRIAMLALLVCGLLVSSTGAGLAISGSSVNGNAAQGQYPPRAPEGDVLGEEDAGGGEQGRQPEGEVRDEEEGGVAPAQQERQVEAGAQAGGGEELPFTGFAAIPILVLGVAMTAGGVVLRRRISRDA